MQNKPTTPQPGTVDGFPSFWYGPDDQSRVCASADEVPEGWVDHPSKVGLEAPKAKKGKAPKAEPVADEPLPFDDDPQPEPAEEDF